MKKRLIDVLVVGAGAAGLMCAIEAGKRGRSVLVLDHANKPGKKILMSGGGRCNFTNLKVSPENYLSHNPHFCRSALSRYQPVDFIKMVESHGIPYHEKTLGQLFCDNKAKDIVNMLLAECEAVSAKVQLETSIKHVLKKDNSYEVQTSSGLLIVESLVVATGGLSIPTMGATAFAYELAKQFDIKVWPTRAGLVPFTWHAADKIRYADLSGIAVDAEISTNKQSFEEALLFTHRGLSGPAALQISSYWHPGDELKICLQPQLDLFASLTEKRASQPDLMLKNALSEYFPKRLLSVWLGEKETLKLKSFNEKQLNEVAQLFQDWHLKPNGTEGYRTAEVTLGGVDCNAISSKTFEATKVPDLYFIGEALDVTGWLGGYNFQWAWASGFAAGAYV